MSYRIRKFLQKGRISFFGSLLFALAIQVAGQVYAKDPTFPAPPPGFRVGMEIELQPRALVGLTRYFDFNKLQAEKGQGLISGLKPDFFDDYLRNYQQGLSELPEDIRMKLTDGLELEGVTAHQEQPLLGSDGKKLNSQSGIILPNHAQQSAQNASPIILDSSALNSQAPHVPKTPSGLVLPKSQTLPAGEKPKELVLPKRMTWEALYDRWKALPYNVKKSLVRWENLAPSKKASLAIDFASGRIDVKSNLPPEEKRLFDRLYWTMDAASGALEFRHREALHVTNPDEFFQDVRELARRAGVENKILNPVDSKNGAAGLHFHISVQGRDLTDLAVELNKLFMVMRVETGNLADLKGGNYTYSRNAQGKGLIKLHGKDRFEVRTHVMPLEEEFRFIMNLLSLDPKEAVKIVGSEIKKRMSNYVVDKMAEYRSEYLHDFKQYMTPEQLHRIEPAINSLAYLETAKEKFRDSKTLPEDFWKRAPALMTSKDPNINMTAISLVVDQPHWPKEVWDKIPTLMASDHGWTQRSIALALGRQPNWPKEVWDQIPAMIKISQDSSVPQSLFQAISKEKSWPKEFWKNVPEYLSSKDHYLPYYMMEALKKQPHWPQEFLDKVPELKAKMQSSALQVFEGALHEHLSAHAARNCVLEQVSHGLR